MTSKEKALLEVMNSKDLSDEVKLYIVQNLQDNTVKQEPVKEKQPTSEDYFPDVKPRLFNPEASLGDFPTMNDAMEAMKNACGVPDSYIADLKK